MAAGTVRRPGTVPADSVQVNKRGGEERLPAEGGGWPGWDREQEGRALQERVLARFSGSRAQPRPEQELPPRPMGGLSLLRHLPSPTPPTARPEPGGAVPVRGRVACGHRSLRLVAPGVMSRGAGSRLRTRPLPQSPVPVPGRGRSARSDAPLRWGPWSAGPRCCPWAGSWARKQGIP